MNIFKTLERSMINSLTQTFSVLGKDALVIASHQNGPEPKKSYCVVNVLDMNRQGYASKSGLADWNGNQAKEYSSQAYDSLVQLNFYGSDASDLASLLHSQYRSNTEVRQHWLRNNLAPREISGLRRAPQLRDTKWIDSFACDVRVGFVVRTIQDVDWVDEVVVNGHTIPLTDS